MVIPRGIPAAAIAALREHVCDFLVKPFKVEELCAVVISALTACTHDIEVISGILNG
jgi:FixJ family two-component response regulator